MTKKFNEQMMETTTDYEQLANGDLFAEAVEVKEEVLPIDPPVVPEAPKKKGPKKATKKEEAKPLNVRQKLMLVQAELKAPKSQVNTFGNYNYRNVEDILEAAKPLLKKYGAIVLLSDSMTVEADAMTVEEKKREVKMDSNGFMLTDSAGAPIYEESYTKTTGNRVYLVATATFVDVESGEKIEVTARAREALDKKKMDPSQITGSCSSYARKYALNGLLLTDDSKDADSSAPQQQQPRRQQAKQGQWQQQKQTQWKQQAQPTQTQWKQTQQTQPRQTTKDIRQASLNKLAVSTGLGNVYVSNQVNKSLVKLNKQSIEQMTAEEFTTLVNWIQAKGQELQG